MASVTSFTARPMASAPAVLAALCAALLGGCAVYQPPPAVLADGTLTYSSPAVVTAAPAYPVAPYAVAPYPVAPYYVGPPVSLGLWFGDGGGYYRHSWGGRYYGHAGFHRGPGGFGRGHGGFHRGGGGRHR